MIVNRERQSELIGLAIIWILAVMMQLAFCMVIDDFISDHVFKADFVARNLFQIWAFYMAHDRLFWGFCLGLLCGWGAIGLEGQIELETAVFITGLVAVFIGGISKLLDTGHMVWKDPIFFFECAPLSALLWQLFYLGALRLEEWRANRSDKAENLKGDLKAVKVEDNPKAQVPEKVLVEEPKELKKEDKPVEKPPVTPKEPPAEPTQKSFWRID